MFMYRNYSNDLFVRGMQKGAYVLGVVIAVAFLSYVLPRVIIGINEHTKASLEERVDGNFESVEEKGN